MPRGAGCGRQDALAERPPQRDAIDDLQERQGAGLDDVGADGAAAQAPAVVLGLDVRLALGVLADRDAADAVIAQLHLDAGDALDRLEDGVDRAVADGGVAVDRAVLVPQARPPPTGWCRSRRCR